MKRLLVLALVLLGTSIVATPAASPAGDAKGPPCANITSGDGGYSSVGGIDFTVFLQAPACSFITYSFFVTDTSGNAITPVPALQDSDCIPETDGGCVHFVYTLPSGSPSTVCVYATTKIHGHLADRAPNPPADQLCPALSPSITLVRDVGGASGTFG